MESVAGRITNIITSDGSVTLVLDGDGEFDDVCTCDGGYAYYERQNGSSLTHVSMPSTFFKTQIKAGDSVVITNVTTALGGAQRYSVAFNSTVKRISDNNTTSGRLSCITKRNMLHVDEETGVVNVRGVLRFVCDYLYAVGAAYISVLHYPFDISSLIDRTVEIYHVHVLPSPCGVSHDLWYTRKQSDNACHFLMPNDMYIFGDGDALLYRDRPWLAMCTRSLIRCEQQIDLIPLTLSPLSHYDIMSVRDVIRACAKLNTSAFEVLSWICPQNVGCDTARDSQPFCVVNVSDLTAPECHNDEVWLSRWHYSPARRRHDITVPLSHFRYCAPCGAVYLVGYARNDNGRNVLEDLNTGKCIPYIGHVEIPGLVVIRDCSISFNDKQPTVMGNGIIVNRTCSVPRYIAFDRSKLFMVLGRGLPFLDSSLVIHVYRCTDFTEKHLTITGTPLTFRRAALTPGSVFYCQSDGTTISDEAYSVVCLCCASGRTSTCNNVVIVDDSLFDTVTSYNKRINERVDGMEMMGNGRISVTGTVSRVYVVCGYNHLVMMRGIMIVIPWLYDCGSLCEGCRVSIDGLDERAPGLLMYNMDSTITYHGGNEYPESPFKSQSNPVVPYNVGCDICSVVCRCHMSFAHCFSSRYPMPKRSRTCPDEYTVRLTGSLIEFVIDHVTYCRNCLVIRSAPLVISAIDGVPINHGSCMHENTTTDVILVMSLDNGVVISYVYVIGVQRVIAALRLPVNLQREFQQTCIRESISSTTRDGKRSCFDWAFGDVEMQGYAVADQRYVMTAITRDLRS